MATPAQQLETERWRALALALARVESLLSDCTDKLSAANATISRQADTIAALNARIASLEATAAAHPLRQLWTAFLTGDWRAKAAMIVPPLLFAYALAVGQSLPALAADLLTTARVCTTGRPEPTHGP
jgi:hypothetical protein